MTQVDHLSKEREALIKGWGLTCDFTVYQQRCNMASGLHSIIARNIQSKEGLTHSFLFIFFPDDLSESRLKVLWSTRVGKPKSPDLVQQDATEESQDIQQQETDKSQATQDQNDHSVEFFDEPFVKAAAIFREGKTEGVIDLLTEAVKNGTLKQCVLYEWSS